MTLFEQYQNEALLLSNARKAHCYMNALRHADKMLAIAHKMGDDTLMQVAREQQEQADRSVRAWA